MSDAKLTTEQAMEYIPMARGTLNTLCSKKLIPYYRFGKRRYFRIEDLDAFVESKRIEAKSE